MAQFFVKNVFLRLRRGIPLGYAYVFPVTFQSFPNNFGTVCSRFPPTLAGLRSGPFKEISTGQIWLWPNFQWDLADVNVDAVCSLIIS